MEETIVDLDAVAKMGVESVAETPDAFYIQPKKSSKYDQTMYRKDKKTGKLTKETVTSCIMDYDDYYDPDKCVDVTETHSLW